MTTQVLSAGNAGPSPADIRGVPFTRLVKVELRKSYDTRAGMWLLAAIGLITTAAIVIFFFVGKPVDLTYDNFLAAAGIPQSILLPVLGILLVTSEWGQRTGLVTFTLEPNRWRIIWAKIVAAVLLGLIAVVIAFAVGALANLVGMGLRDGAGTWDYSFADFGKIALLQLIGILGGLAYGMVLLNSAAAIVLSFALPTVTTIVFSWSKLADERPWLDPNTAQGPLTADQMTGTEWTHLLVNIGIWIILPIAVGMWRVLRSEVKSS